MKVKELVTLRRKPLDTGGCSLFLDYTLDGIRRKEYLKMYLVPEKSKIDKELNKQTLAAADTIRARKIIDIQKGIAGIPRVVGDDILLTDYISQQAEDYKERGHVEHANTLVKLARWIDDYMRRVSLRQVDREFLLGYIKHLQKNLSPYSAHVYFANLNTVLNRAFRADLIAMNPVSKLDPSIKPKKPDADREYLTLDEVKALMETDCKRDIVKRAFLFSCFTGLRISDIESLTWGGIKKTGSGWQVEERQKKTKEIVAVPLSGNAIVQLPKRGKPTDLVWPNLPSRTQININIKNWVKAAGIEKDISFHCSRHTFATLSLTYGADIYTVKELMGHKDIASTQVYAKVVSEKKVDAVNLIPDLTSGTPEPAD